MQKRAAQKHLRVWQSGGALSSVPPHSEVPGSHCQALHSTDTGQESLSLRGWQAGWQAGEPPRSPRRPSAVPTLACQEAGSCAAGGRAQAESWAGGCAQHIWKCLQCASSRSRRHTRTHTHAHTLARPQPAVHAPLPGGFPRGSLQMRPGHATSEAAAPGGAGPGARGRDTGHRTPAPPAQCSDYLFRRLCMCTVVCTLVRLGWVRPSVPPLESWTDPHLPSQIRNLEPGPGILGGTGWLGRRCRGMGVPPCWVGGDAGRAGEDDREDRAHGEVAGVGNCLSA